MHLCTRLSQDADAGIRVWQLGSPTSRFQNRSGQALPCWKALMAQQGFRTELKFQASPLSLFRTSHGANKETEMALLCRAPGALCGWLPGCVPPYGHPHCRSCLGVWAPFLNPTDTCTAQLRCHHSLEAIHTVPDGNARRVAGALCLIVGSPISPAWAQGAQGLCLGTGPRILGPRCGQSSMELD